MTEQEPCWDCRADYWACGADNCHGYHCKCDREKHPDGMTVCAHDDYDWPCPTYNIVATERTPEDDNR